MRPLPRQPRTPGECLCQRAGTHLRADTVSICGHTHRALPSCGQVLFPGNAPASCREVRYDVLNTHGCVCPLGGVHWVQSIHRAWLVRANSSGRHFHVRIKRLNLYPSDCSALKEDISAKEIIERHRHDPGVKEDLRRYYGVPADDVVVIPNGFSADGVL